MGLIRGLRSILSVMLLVYDFLGVISILEIKVYVMLERAVQLPPSN